MGLFGRGPQNEAKQEKNEESVDDILDENDQKRRERKLAMRYINLTKTVDKLEKRLAALEDKVENIDADVEELYNPDDTIELQAET